MQPLRERILEYMGHEAYRPLKPKDIAKVLGISQIEYGSFRRTLRELAREGRIIKIKKGRYGVPVKLNLSVGRISMTSSGFGFVVQESGGPDIYVPASNTGVALHGDKVIARLLRKGSRKDSPEGEIIRVIERSARSVVGTYHHGKHFGYVEPDDSRITRDIYVANEDSMDAIEGQKVVTLIEEWKSGHLNPEGRITEVLGFPNESGIDILSVIKSYDLPISFPADAVGEAERIPFQVPPEELERRSDFRNIVCFTIDPEDAKDFDDAVSLQINDRDNYLLGVHIADVSYYVREGSLLDQEALVRGTSVYLVDRVLPMLPERLSNEICSLKPDQDRLTMSVIAEIDQSGNVLGYEIVDSVIRSSARLTYEQVQSIIDKRGDELSSEIDGLRDCIIMMHQLSNVLTEKRVKRGAIDFDLPEAKVLLNENGIPIDIRPRKRLQSHRLIEEFMLIANEIVATHVYNLGLPFLYRVHDIPDLLKLKEFGEFVGSLGYTFNLKGQVKPSNIQRFLKQLEGQQEEWLINEFLLRSMKRALYTPDNIGHFGLACEFYTHFTSPIRRYPDLLVHRILREIASQRMTQERQEILKEKLPRVGEIASERERVADEAEWESVKIKQIQFMEDKLGDTYWGIISGVRSFGFFVELEDSLIEGLVHVSQLYDDYYIFDDRRHALIGEHTRKVYRMGDRIHVRVVKVDRNLKRVDFLPIQNGKKPATSGKRSRRGR